MTRNALILSCLLFLAMTATVAEPANEQSTMTQELNDLWDDPQFQRDFMGSFGTNSEVEPSVSLIEREQMQRVLTFLAEDDTESAKLALKELIEPPKKTKKRRGDEASPQRPNALYYFTLANLYFQEEDLESAKPYYESAIEVFPAFRRAYKNLGLINIRQGDYQAAVGNFSRVIELGGNDGLTFGLLGYAYMSDQQFLSAESAFRNALLLQRDQENWKIGLTQSVLKQRRYAEAVTLAQELIVKHPSKPDFWLLQANAYIGMGQPLEAAKNYEILDRMGQANSPALNTLGDIYVNERMWELATRAYSRAMDLDPKQDPSRPIRCVEILAMRGAATEARELMAKVRTTLGSELDGDDKIQLLKLEARMAVADGGAGEAVEVLENIVALDPLDGDALIMLGQHYSENDTDKAILYFERAEGLGEFEADAKLRHGQVLVAQGNYREAIPLLKRSQELDPRDDVARYIAQVERIARTNR